MKGSTQVASKLAPTRAMSPTVVIVVFVLLVGLAFWAQRRPRAVRLAAEIEPGVVTLEDEIDLHGFRPKEIPDVVESYLEAALEAGMREVRLVHGKGKGVQRARVRELLAAHPNVVAFGDAPAHRGGWGAQLVSLREDPNDEGAPSQTGHAPKT